MTALSQPQHHGLNSSKQYPLIMVILQPCQHKLGFWLRASEQIVGPLSAVGLCLACFVQGAFSEKTDRGLKPKPLNRKRIRRLGRSLTPGGAGSGFRRGPRRIMRCKFKSVMLVIIIGCV